LSKKLDEGAQNGRISFALCAFLVYTVTITDSMQE